MKKFLTHAGITIMIVLNVMNGNVGWTVAWVAILVLATFTSALDREA